MIQVVQFMSFCSDGAKDGANFEQRFAEKVTITLLINRGVFSLEHLETGEFTKMRESLN